MNETKDGRHEISWTEKLSHYRSTTIPLVACCKNDQIINLVISDMYINLKSWKSGNGMLNHEIWLNIATISKMWPSKNMSLMRRKVWPTQNKTPYKNCPAQSTSYAEFTRTFFWKRTNDLPTLKAHNSRPTSHANCFTCSTHAI